MAVLLAASVLGCIVGAAPPAHAERAPRGSKRYTLQDGDRLVHLAKEHGVSVDDILAVNDLRDARDLRAGEEILIPAKGWGKSRAAKARRSASAQRRAIRPASRNDSRHDSWSWPPR